MFKHGGLHTLSQHSTSLTVCPLDFLLTLMTWISTSRVFKIFHNLVAIGFIYCVLLPVFLIVKEQSMLSLLQMVTLEVFWFKTWIGFFFFFVSLYRTSFWMFLRVINGFCHGYLTSYLWDIYIDEYRNGLHLISHFLEGVSIMKQYLLQPNLWGIGFCVRAGTLLPLKVIANRFLVLNE